MSIPSTTLGAAAIAALLTLYSPAAPVAVNDNYTTPEDTAVGSGPGELFSAGFDGSAAITFSLPAAWQIIDLKTTAAGGTNLYPEDAQARSWKTAGFDSATSSIPGWRSGTLPVQAGGISHANFTNVPATLTGLVAGGPNTVNTYLVRNTFSMNAAQAAHSYWEFSILADDGCVIYVNGVERGRLNFPAGTPLEPDGLNGGGTGDESNYTTLSADLTGLLVAGTNVIALELHQNTTSSTDAGIDFTMSPATLGATSGFTEVDDAFFGTARADFSTQTYAATGGFNGTGALKVQMGNVLAFGGSQAVSGAWRRVFNLTAPATISLSFRHRLISGQDYDNNEYQELICDIDGTQYGTVTAPSIHPAVSYQIGNGNGGAALDSGWKTSSFSIPLGAGSHTLSLGGYGNGGTPGLNGALESFEGFFDDVVVRLGGSASLLANDTGGLAPVTALKASDPAHGSLVIYDNGSFNYVPQNNYFGPDNFTYRAVDSSGSSAPAVVTINVTPVNDAPVALADGPYVTTQDVPLVVPAGQGVLTNDSDPETTTLTAVAGTATPDGILQLNANGSFTFTPKSGFAGTTSFTYRASDGTAQSAPATVSIQVTDIPDAPVAAADSYTVAKNSPLIVSATVGGSTTADVLTYKATDWHYYDSLLLADRNLETAWRTNAYTESAAWKSGPAELGYGDGDEATQIADNPDPAFVQGAVDKFATSYFRRRVDVTDYATITGVEVSVIYDDACAIFLNGTPAGRTNNLPDPATLPELAWDYFATGNSGENSTQTFNLPASVLQPGTNLIAAEVYQNAANSSDVSFDLRLRVNRATAAGVLANDTDPDTGHAAALTANLVTPPAHGSLTLNPNGTFTFTPVNNYIGPDSFTYRAQDPTNRTSAAATVVLTIIDGPNVPPIARPESYMAQEDALLTIDAAGGLLANDTDAEGDAFTAIVATPPAKGTLNLNPNGSFSYQPAANFNGTDTFTYQASDRRPSAPVTVTITVSAVNDLPTALNDSYAGDPGVPFVVGTAQGVLANDTDVDAATVLSAELITPPASGTLILNSDGSFSFTAPVGGVYNFSYRARDAISQSPPANVTIALNAVPLTRPDSYATNEDSSLNIAPAQGVLSNDNDPEGQPLTLELVSDVQRGTLQLNPNGSFLYTPGLNFQGVDGFTYRARDGTRTSAPVSVFLTVNPVNDAPVAVPDTYGVRLDSPLEINAANGVLRNDSDVENSPLTVTLVRPPASGELLLKSDGSFLYRPEAGFSGAATFSYQISDGTAQSAVVPVTLNVSALLNTILISEIMYNPPGVTGLSEEFVEIYNYADVAVDLSAWSFTKGVDYTFPPGVLLPGRSYLAIPADRTGFVSKYPANTNVTATGWGPESSLGNGGELLRLKNAMGETVDEVEYSNQGDWAVRKLVNVWDSTNSPGLVPPALDTDPGLEWVTPADPDPGLGIAGGASIQLINRLLNNDFGQNWTAAPPTPGAANSGVILADSAPLIQQVRHSPAVPDRTQQVFITARIEDEKASGITAAVVFRTWMPNGTTPATPFTEVAMADNGLRNDGAAGDGIFGAVIPAHALATVVEFYVKATDSASNLRTWPAPVLDLEGANPSQAANCLYQVNEEVWTDARPLYQMVLTGADNESWNAGLTNRNSNVAPNTTVIFRTGNQIDVRYLASVRVRGNSSRGDTPLNLRMDLPKDQPWNGRTGFTLNYKFSYSQFLGTRLFEAAGIPCEKAGLVGARINGMNRLLDENGNRTFGLYCDMIPRGGETIKEWFPGNDKGNSYGKIRGSTRWGVSTLPTIGAAGYAVGGYVNQGYNKQSNASLNDWTDLHAWVTSLNVGTAETFHNTIAHTVDVDQWCRFLALSTIINHAETNIANGDDDDYSVYFGATDKLCRIIPHDLDTCFNLRAIGLGDEDAPPTISIYQCTEPDYPRDGATLPQMEKFYRNPILGRKFKATLRHYLNTLFKKDQFDATVDRLLDPQWMGVQFTPNGDAIRNHIKSFLDTRRTTIEAFLPVDFTATTTLAVQNGLPRSASATDLGGLGGKLDPARTASVTVNGLAVTTNPYGSTGPGDNTWSAGTAITLSPGINTLICEARDENDRVFETRSVTIWYDAAGVNRSGTVAGSETWTRSQGPYNITGNLSVPNGATLTIQPGTTVFLAAGVDLTVASGGRLMALGTAGSGITLTRLPSSTGNWGGITVNGGSAQLSYVNFANNGSTAFHSQNGAVVSLDHLSFQNTGVQYLSLDGSSFTVSDCVFPTSTGNFEPVHGTGGIAAGGQGIIRNCWFGKTINYNDSIDFTGGNRPGPILQVLNCVFTGSDDDILDLDSTDAWIEGNVFMHTHRNNGAPDSSSAVSGGADNASYSQVTVINNLIYDCDNAVTMKQSTQPNGNSAVLLNNTIVRITRTGGVDTGSGVVNFDDDNVAGEGKGMYLEGNIIQDVESLTRNYNPALSQLTLHNNILPVAPPAGSTASGNIVGDPLLNLALIPNPATATAEQVMAALKPQLCSPAIGSGPLGRTLGADLTRTGITLQSLPASTWPASVTLALGPGGSFTPTSQPAWTYGFTHYRYRLDGGPLTAELPIAAPLSLTGLSTGSHLLVVEGKNDAGFWQDVPAEYSFRVASKAPTVVLSEVLANSTTVPDMIELYNWGSAPASVAGCMLSDDPGLPGKYTFPPAAAAIPAGGYLVLDSAQLGFDINKGGETIRFSSPTSELLDSVVFGPQLLNFTIARSGTAWRLATPTPGTATTAVCSISPGKNLRINEWLGSNDIIVSGDFVELYNPDVLPVDLAGFRLSQDFRNEPSQSQFPPLSFIAGSGFLELKADGDSAAGADHLNFKISRIHDSIALLDPAGRVLDNVIVLPGNPDVSQGRTPDGSVASKYLALPTPGFSNSSDLSADTAVMNGLRITEIMFDPPGTGAEFIEFRNIAAAALTITGVTFDSGLTFTFPATTIPPGGYAVITQNLTTFSSQYPGLPAVQWTSGRLDNNGETLRIATGTYGLGILDFRYEGNWYPETRAGASLAIVNPAAQRSTWSDQASWQPAQPSPGGPAPFGVLAPADSIVTLPQPASLRSWISPGIHPLGSITVLWRKVSGPGAVTFAAPANRVTDASFSLPGIYELSITATPPGGGAVALDKVTIAAGEVYASWASRYLGSVSAANRQPGADPDNDGQLNLIEYVMGTSPTLASAGPEPILNQGRLALRYPVSKLIDPAVLIIPQISGNLTSWREGGTWLNHFIQEETATSAIHIAESPDPVSANPRTYLRLKVILP